VRLVEVLTELPSTRVGLCYLRSRVAFSGNQCRAEGGLQDQLLLAVLHRFRQRLEYLQPLGEVPDRFQIRRTLDGALTRPLPIAHGLHTQARFGVMIRHQLGLGLGNLWKSCDENLRNALMVLQPRAPQERLIGGILDEGMLEDIRRLRR
jgi:hypothetical protein